MSTYGILATLVAPELKEVTQPELIAFETEYMAYKENVIDINRSRDASRKITAASIKNCIEPILMQSLCILSEIIGAKSIEDATDASVYTWLDLSVSTAPRDKAERIRSALEAVKFAQCQKYPAGAVLTFVLDTIQELYKNNASEVVKDGESCKGLINKLVDSLEPSDLRELVKDSRKCWIKDPTGDLDFSRKKASNLAVDVAEEEVARNRLSRKRGQPFRNLEDKASAGPRKAIQKAFRNKKPFNGRHSKPKTTSPSEKELCSKWSTPCLNQKCPEIHRLKDCLNRN